MVEWQWHPEVREQRQRLVASKGDSQRLVEEGRVVVAESLLWHSERTSLRRVVGE